MANDNKNTVGVPAFRELRGKIYRLCLCFLPIASISFCLIAHAQSENKETSPSPKTLQVGFSSKIFSDLELKDALIATKYWLNSVDKARWNFNPILFHDLDSIINAVNTGSIIGIVLNTLEYFLIKDKVDLEPFMEGGYYDGKGTEIYLLLVRKDKNITSLKDLKNKKIMMEGGRQSFVGQLWIDTLLLREGLSESKVFFSLVKNAEKPSQAVLSVFFNQTDACIVTKRAFSTMVELNPQLNNELTSLISSQELLPDIICFTKAISQEEKRDLKIGFFNMHNVAGTSRA